MKILPLKKREIKISDCGACPFFDYGNDLYDHRCRIETLAFVSIHGIPPECPLYDAIRLPNIG
jgi:hypothetical protein